MADTAVPPATNRLSRYRSQRRPQSSSPVVASESFPAPQSSSSEDPAPPADPIARSKSRYHRKNADASRPATSRPATSRRPPDQNASTVRPVGSQSPPQHAFASAARAQRQFSAGQGDNARPGEPSARNIRRVYSNDHDGTPTSGRECATQAQHRSPGRRPNEPADSRSTQPSQHVGQLFPPPKPEPSVQPAKLGIPDGPPTSDQIRATKSMSALPQFTEEEDDEDGGCFGLFKRKRGDGVPAQDGMAPVARPNNSNEHTAIKAGGGGAVPGIDAPVSAVNAGDRRVLVECGRTRTMFPVTPTTTPVDLMKSASTCMPERIDVRSALLLEYFGAVGVQRPLRRYEHVRDVMNSWDTDDQNSLLLVDPRTGNSEEELSVEGVPTEKPADESWIMSFSQKPGKWDKRFIVLRSDGQISMLKDANKPRDQVNICHLSDFDIYMPTQEKLKKKIKPPKKLCYAIKSQQKTSMFESTHDFVHFFCTNDKPTGDAFYAAVQRWRSWYLVNVMGEGRNSKPVGNQASGREPLLKTNDDKFAKSHKPGVSEDSTYQLGSFQPLLEMGQFDNQRRPRTAKGAESSHPAQSSSGFATAVNQPDASVSPERRAGRVKGQAHPPGSMATRTQLADDEPLARLGRRSSTDRRRSSTDQPGDIGDREFASGGLLGRSYSQRQRELNDRDAPPQQPQPFSTGPTLLNGSAEQSADAELPSRRRSLDASSAAPHRTRSTRAGGDMKRSSSRRDPQPRASTELRRPGSVRRDPNAKPLIDLTPQYREPPQHSKRGKGRGFRPDESSGTEPTGPLINSATTPEDPLNVPPSTDWRVRAGGDPSGGANLAGTAAGATPTNLQRGLSARRGAGPQRPSGPLAPASAAAFTGEGLLSSSAAAQGWGDGQRGRGVMDSSRAARLPGGKPMVDVTEPSLFAKGSLLNQAGERDRPMPGKVDRSRE